MFPLRLAHSPDALLAGGHAEARRQGELEGRRDEVTRQQPDPVSVLRHARCYDRRRDFELDSDRDRWFTPQQALEYGFIDSVITSAHEAADEGRPAR